MLIFKQVVPTPLDNAQTFRLAIHENCTILTVQEQRGELVLWYLYDSKELLVEPTTPEPTVRASVFQWFTTGAEVSPRHWEYIKTVQFHDGALVYHLFRKKRAQ